MATELETRLMGITEVFAQGDVDGALAQMSELEASCHTDPERSQILARYATFFHLLELRDEELSVLAQALILDPTNARAHYLKAIHLMIDERWDDAITALNTAARYYPVDDQVHLAEVYGNLSYCWGQLEDADRAAMYEEICADLDPSGVEGIEGEEGAIWPEEFEVELEPTTSESLAAHVGHAAEGSDSVQPLETGAVLSSGTRVADGEDVAGTGTVIASAQGARTAQVSGADSAPETQSPALGESAGDIQEAGSASETLERLMRDLGKKARKHSSRKSRSRRKRKKKAVEHVIREADPISGETEQTLDSASPPEKDDTGDEKKPRDVRPSPGRRPAGRRKRPGARVRR